MSKETFSLRLRAAMAREGKKQGGSDPRRFRAGRQAWQEPHQPVCKRQDSSPARYHALSCRCAAGR